MVKFRSFIAFCALIAVVLGMAVPAFADNSTAQQSALSQPIDLPLTDPFDSVALATAGDGPKWYDTIHLGGKFRFRNEYRYTEAGFANVIPGYGVSGYRMRFRLLLNLTGELENKMIEFGVTLGTGFTATSGNQTFGDGTLGGTPDFAPSAILVRSAWARINMFDQMLHITLGAMPFPKEMFRSVITFDPDVSLTGAHIQADLMKSDKDAADKMKFIINGLTLFVNQDATNMQRHVWGFAANAVFGVGPLTAQAGFWAFTHANVNYANIGAANKVEAVEVAVAFAAEPIKAFVHFLLNLGAPEKQNLAFLLGVQFGTKKKAGDFYAEAIFYYSEARSFPTVFADDTIARLSVPGSSGGHLVVTYMLETSLALSLNINFSYLLGDQRPNTGDTDLYTSYILDLEFYFD